MRKGNEERNHNWHEARKYFKETGQWFKGAVMHHIDPTLRYRDYERYLEWRIEDLVVMTNSEHTKIHIQAGTANLRGMAGKHHTEESKQKSRESNTGQKRSEETRRKISEKAAGRVQSEETKRKISEGLKRRWAKYREEKALCINS